MEKEYLNIGKNLRRVLKEKNISQKELGKMLGITGVSVGEILRKKSIQVSRLLEICELLNIPVTDLVPTSLLRLEGVCFEDLITEGERGNYIMELQSQIIQLQNKLLLGENKKA